MASPLLDSSKNGFRTWFRKVWKVRGGGLYACGFAVAFIILEVGSLADDVTGIGALFNGGAISFLIGFEETSSFFRAVREWADKTPESARFAVTA